MITRICTILMLFFTLPILGQLNYGLTFKSREYTSFIKKPKTKFKDSTSARSYLREFQLTAISKGYLLASIDSIKFSSNNAIVHFFLGEKFTDAKIGATKEEFSFIRKNAKVNEKFFAQVPFIPKELASILKKINAAYLNNGFPFCSVSLITRKLDKGQIVADLNIEQGPFLKWIKINIRGDSSISRKYLSNLLNIKVGEKYNEAITKKISSRIKQVPFLKEIKPAEFLYTKQGIELFVYIESIPISSVNGVIGFQPDPISSKLTVTGELSLKLQNMLKRGELLDVQWQSIRAETQSLDAHLNYPFLFNTPFGIDGTFNLYKRDTSFIELNSSIGIEYYLDAGTVIKAFYKNITTSILSGGQNNPIYTSLGSAKSNNYGLSFYKKQIDYIPNPTRGYSVTISASLGNRVSQINDTTLQMESSTSRGYSLVNLYFPITKRHVIRFSNLTEFYSAPDIFQNELNRFGGLTNQRGFDEDELLSTTKSSSTLEYRFLLDKDSHVFAFYDQTWYENNTGNYYKDTPYGFGVGFSFSTNFGVFSISYALGKQFENPVLLNNSKVHFGYIVYF